MSTAMNYTVTASRGFRPAKSLTKKLSDMSTDNFRDLRDKWTAPGSHNSGLFSTVKVTGSRAVKVSTGDTGFGHYLNLLRGTKSKHAPRVYYRFTVDRTTRDRGWLRPDHFVVMEALERAEDYFRGEGVDWSSIWYVVKESVDADQDLEEMYDEIMGRLDRFPRSTLTRAMCKRLFPRSLIEYIQYLWDHMGSVSEDMHSENVMLRREQDGTMTVVITDPFS